MPGMCLLVLPAHDIHVVSLLHSFWLPLYMSASAPSGLLGVVHCHHHTAVYVWLSYLACVPNYLWSLVVAGHVSEWTHSAPAVACGQLVSWFVSCMLCASSSSAVEQDLPNRCISHLSAVSIPMPKPPVTVPRQVSVIHTPMPQQTDATCLRTAGPNTHLQLQHNIQMPCCVHSMHHAAPQVEK